MRFAKQLPVRLMACTAALALLSACEDGFDFDLRGKMGGSFDTSEAAKQATAKRPQPDERGIISYPNYQVAVAQRGDRLVDVANRIGMDPETLARHNGMQPNDTLRAGEVIALPKRVAEPTGGPIQPPSDGTDITSIAGAAIDRAEAPTVETTTLEPSSPAPAQTGVEPVKHKVERGETAYTIARLYGVSIRALAEWNGLDKEFSIREGQHLLIPVVLDGEEQAAAAPMETIVTAPGQGSPTPTPPSSTKPLPAETPAPAAAPVPAPKQENLGATQTAASTASNARMQMPVSGAIIREYTKGKTDGIDISASTGSPVKAAASGVVGAITSDTSGKNIVVLKHPDGLLTVYANVGEIKVQKGDSISRGQTIASVGSGSPSYVRFGIYKGSESIDPGPYLR